MFRSTIASRLSLLPAVIAIWHPRLTLRMACLTNVLVALLAPAQIILRPRHPSPVFGRLPCPQVLNIISIG